MNFIVWMNELNFIHFLADCIAVGLVNTVRNRLLFESLIKVTFSVCLILSWFWSHNTTHTVCMNLSRKARSFHRNWSYHLSVSLKVSGKTRLFISEFLDLPNNFQNHLHFSGSHFVSKQLGMTANVKKMVSYSCNINSRLHGWWTF